MVMRFGSFRLTDILVGTACGAVLLTTAALAIGPARERDNRAKCGKNLTGIMMSMVVYSAENNDVYPVVPSASSTKYDPLLKPDAAAGTADEVIKGYYEKAGRQPGNIGANLWILVLKQQTTPKQYICPSDPYALAEAALVHPKGDAKKWNTNFDAATLSYSTAYPWIAGADGKSAVVGGWWKNLTDSSLPILSDMAPYIDPAGKKEDVITLETLCPVKAEADEGNTSANTGPAPATNASTQLAQPGAKYPNSQNHGGDGQTIIYQDCHATFERRPDIGQDNDNIWTVGLGKDAKPLPGGGIRNGIETRTMPFDIVMVPVRTAKGGVR